MEKAILHIDLCMVYGHPVVLANSFVLASKELIAHMVESTNAAEVYALKNCVIDLCATVLLLVSRYVNPISQLKYSIHVFRLIRRANQILADSVMGHTLYSVNSNSLIWIASSFKKILFSFDLEWAHKTTHWWARSTSVEIGQTLRVKVYQSESVDRHHIRYDQWCCVYQSDQQHNVGKLLPVEYWHLFWSSISTSIPVQPYGGLVEKLVRWDQVRRIQTEVYRSYTW